MRNDKLVSHVLGEESVLAPSDLYSKQFPRATFGGYRAHDVDTYMERVANVLEALNQEVRVLKEQVDERNREINEHRQMEATLRDALVTSQKFGEDVIASAQREAETLLDSARVEKERLLSQALRLPEVLATEIETLQDLRDRLRTEIEAVLSSHQTLLAKQPTTEEALEFAAAHISPSVARLLNRSVFVRDRITQQYLSPTETNEETNTETVS